VSQLWYCNRSASAGNCEDIALLLMVYRDIQGVRTGSGTANSKWERREKILGNLQTVINSSWWQNALQKEENVIVKAINL